MKRVVAMLLLVAGTTLAQQFETITIPTRAAAAIMPRAERRELEILFATTVEKALEDGVVVPGQYVDFTRPDIRFIREYNLWTEKRAALVKAFGIDIFREAIDIKEMTQFDRAISAWVEYCDTVEKNYKQFKRTRQAFKKLERALEQERDGVY